MSSVMSPTWLWAACEEFDVPYALALGLIEKETEFRNLIGDDGASTEFSSLALITVMARPPKSIAMLIRSPPVI